MESERKRIAASLLRNAWGCSPSVSSTALSAICLVNSDGSEHCLENSWYQGWYGDRHLSKAPFYTKRRIAMKKEYLKPTVEVIEIDAQDIIIASGFTEKEDIDNISIDDESSVETPMIEVE